MNNTLFAAFGLMLLLEGLMPLLLPHAWRETFQRLISLKDGQIRFIGLFSVLLGLLILGLSKT